MPRRPLLIALLLFAAVAVGMAQFRQSRQRMPSRGDVPTWEVNPRFPQDVFTIVRVEFNSGRGRGGRSWMTDYPNAELNLSWRLNQMTSLVVSPDPLSLPLTDPRLNDYPFLFMVDPRSIDLDDAEAEALRNYLLNGGFLLVDDFWGNQMWNHIYRQMQRVFPGREPQSLPHDHPIFSIVFPLDGPPQIPSEDSAHRNKDAPDPYRTWEDEINWEQPQPADFRGYFDDRCRLMMLVALNTDMSDGWEEEGISPWFFETYSEKSAFPMAINIITYVMTH
jgi:hypothetical protein